MKGSREYAGDECCKRFALGIIKETLREEYSAELKGELIRHVLR